jgi:ribosomal-protein-alanine N-acetyltransferase
LTLVDGLVSGTVGFKSEPRENRLEVGYGVVPSKRHHGVATTALAQLLTMLEGRELTVRAETDTSNFASQSVLRRLSFEEVARHDDAESGALIVWEWRGDSSV